MYVRMYLRTCAISLLLLNIFQKFKTTISAALEEYIQEICNCTVVLTNANLICINASSAFYTVQLTNQNSVISAFIFELLDFIIMNNGIDLGIAIIRTWTTMEEITNDSDDNEKNSTNWHILLYLLLAMFFTLLILFISYSCYRYICTCVYIYIYVCIYICTYSYIRMHAQACNQTFLKGILNLAWSHTNEKVTQNRNINLKFKLSASKKLAKIGGSSKPLGPPLVKGLIHVPIHIIP